MIEENRLAYQGIIKDEFGKTFLSNLPHQI
jgi:hypothetical protein